MFDSGFSLLEIEQNLRFKLDSLETRQTVKNVQFQDKKGKN